MGWRFRKRIKIFPGFYINISKSGLGVNIGPKGANVSIGPNGTYVNTGIPGTGLYRRDKVDSSIHNSTEIQQESHNYRKQEVTLNVGKEEQQYGDSVVSQLNTHHTPVNQKIIIVRLAMVISQCHTTPKGIWKTITIPLLTY